MGFDLYWATVPDDDGAYSRATETFNQAVKVRDGYERGSDQYEAAQKAVNAAYDAMRDAQPYYYRLNIWGMSDTRQAMSELHMLCDSPEPDHDEWHRVNSMTDEDEQQRETDKLLRRHEGECPGIPWHKLSDNSGWLVLPAEIEAALDLYQHAITHGHDKPALEWWDEWIEWLRAAARHDGFRVY